MIDIAWMATIRHRRHDTVDDPDVRFRLPPQQSARITGGRATVEIGFDLATRNACKTQRSPRTFHGGVFSLVAVGFLTP